MKPVGLPVGLRKRMYGYSPTVPLPDGTDIQDYRYQDGRLIYDPGWWRRLTLPKPPASEAPEKAKKRK